MGQIEVGLVVFRDADQRVHGAKSGAQRDMAGGLFVHVHDEIPFRRHIGRLRPGVHPLEVPQTFQPLLAELDADHVEEFARRHRQFAPDHSILGFRIAVDLDLCDVELLSFLDLELQVHGAAFGVRDLEQIQIA